SCIKCAMCAEEAPEVIVFEATTGPQLKEDVDIVPHSEKIKRAAQFCPKDSIKHHLQ
ncbi:MAG: ferredoxin, partial [Candidatus Brocadia sp.]|nr:ferredoxin [Candidatus Brocadia sp.]